MASSKEYFHYIMDQFDDSVQIRSRAMMGEYILYYHDKVIGGIYVCLASRNPTSAATKIQPLRK